MFKEIQPFVIRENEMSHKTLKNHSTYLSNPFFYQTSVSSSRIICLGGYVQMPHKICSLKGWRWKFYVENDVGNDVFHSSWWWMRYH